MITGRSKKNPRKKRKQRVSGRYWQIPTPFLFIRTHPGICGSTRTDILMTKLYFKQLFAAMLALLCCNAAYSQSFSVDGIYYEITSETDLTANVTCKDFFDPSYTTDSVTIPPTVTYEGKTYTIAGIGVYAFSGCSNVKYVKLPETVKSIEHYAFRNCTSLESINIPDSLTSIGGLAFSACTSLKSVSLPATMRSIDARAFNGCTALSEINILSDVVSVAAYSFDNTEWFKNQPDGPVYWGKCFYCYKGELTEDTEVVVADGTTTIAHYAFSTTRTNSGYFTSITLPASLQQIGGYAFQGCSALESITIPESVTIIPLYMFEGCANLETVNMGKNVTEIGTYAFQNCYSLEELEMGEKLTTIGKFAFKECSSLCEVVIPNSVTNIGESAFQDCSSMESLTIGSGVSSIAKKAFLNCYSLEEIEFLGEINELGEEAFYNTAWYDSQKSGLVYINNILYAYKGTMDPGATINIKEGTRSIANSAFINREELKDVVIPSSLKSIGTTTFSGCTNLSGITFSEGLTTIGNKAFKGCTNLTSIYLPNTMELIDDYAFDGCITLEIADMGNNVKKIGNYVFQGCEKLTEVIIPESVTTIGSNAFKDCKALGTIHIGSNVESMGTYTFYNSSNIKLIYCKAVVPPTLSAGLFSSSANYRNATLYVPVGSAEAYKAAEIWSKFTNIKEYDYTGIDNVETKALSFNKTAEGIVLIGADDKKVSVYNVVGILVEKTDSYAGETIKLDSGIYLIRVDGKTTKIRL